MTVNQADNILDFADRQNQHLLLVSRRITQHIKQKAVFAVEYMAQFRVMVLHKANEICLHNVQENLEQVGPLHQLVLVEVTHLIYFSLLLSSHVVEPHLSLVVQGLLGLALEHRLEDLLEALYQVDFLLNLESEMLFDLLGYLRHSDAMARKVFDVSENSLRSEDPLVLLLCQESLYFLPQRTDRPVRVVRAADILLQHILAELVVQLQL